MLSFVVVATAATLPLRLLEWNVYYKALDDEYGRAAITSSIDATGSPLDFVVLAEAAGDTPAGALAAWPHSSRALTALTSLNATSRFETLAIFYDADRWSATHLAHGDFEPGRPYMLAHFEHTSDAAPGASLWVVLVHLPHFLDTKVSPGAILANALKSAAATSGKAVDNIVLAGDWNEFQWEDNPCRQPYYPKDCREQARARAN